MQDIDYINAMLRGAGLTPLHYTETEHPDYLNAVPILTEQYTNILAQRLWFNTEIRDFAPNTDSNIVLPAGTLSAIPLYDDDKYLVQRGSMMYNTRLGNFDFHRPVRLRIAASVPREEFPASVAEYLRAAAVMAFYEQEVGEGARLQTHMQSKQAAWATVWKDHVKGQGANLFDYTHSLGARLRYGSVAPVGALGSSVRGFRP